MSISQRLLVESSDLEYRAAFSFLLIGVKVPVVIIPVSGMYKITRSAVVVVIIVVSRKVVPLLK